MRDKNAGCEIKIRDKKCEMRDKNTRCEIKLRDKNARCEIKNADERCEIEYCEIPGQAPWSRKKGKAKAGRTDSQCGFYGCVNL